MSDRAKGFGCLIILAVIALVIVQLAEWIYAESIPYDFFHFWKIGGSMTEAVKNSWPWLVWGSSMNLVLYYSEKGHAPDKGADYLSAGLVISTKAAIGEEISFRWFIFYAAILTAKVGNWVLFGFMGHGIPEWFFDHAVGPLVDFVTFGWLHSILFSPEGWAVGAAVVATTGKFRDGHEYQGVFGWTNSWFLGLYFMYVMFHYGLPAAMAVHFVYNMTIFFWMYVASKLAGN